MDLRLGLAGLGIHGRRYAEHLLRGEVAGARLVAISRSEPAAGERFAREHGLRFVADPQALATRGGVDAVVLVLPPDLHAPACLAALGAGKPVLVEKPLAADAAAAREVAAAVARSGVPLLLGQTLRFDPLVERLRAEAETIGPLRAVSINQRFEPADRPWIDRPGPGGLLLNTGVHGFDLLRHLSGGEAAWISAECRTIETCETEDGFAAIVTLEPGGVLGLLDNTRTTRSRSGRIELVGRDGQLWGDHVHRTLQRVSGRTVTDLGPVPAAATIPRVLGHFVRMLRQAEPPAVTAADGVASLELIEAARAAASSGRRVRVGTPSTSTPDGLGCRD